MVSAVTTMVRSKMPDNEIKDTIFKTCAKSVSVAGESGSFLDKNNLEDLEKAKTDPLKKIQPEDIGNICNVLMKDIADDMISTLKGAAEAGNTATADLYCKTKTIPGKLGGNSICSVSKTEFVDRLKGLSKKEMMQDPRKHAIDPLELARLSRNRESSKNDL